MWKYVLKRLVMLIPVLLGVILIIFVLNEITPGDPARELAGDLATEEEVAQLREEMGLNRPFAVRFGDYVWNLVTKGDLGTSYQTKQPVLKEIMQRFPTTLLLTALSTTFMVIVGVSFGVISATRQYSVLDNICSVLGLIGVSMPTFWQGLMMILIFAIKLDILPASGFYGPEYWILTAFTIGTANGAQIMRMTRSSMLDVIHQDYIRSAEAKGLSHGTIIRKHALRNALIPILTVIGMNIGHLLGGAVVTESVFAIPGLGKYMIDAIKARNYPVIQGGVLVLAFSFSIITILVDVLYAFADPRVKAMYKGSEKRVRKSKQKEATANG